jgi:SAM-dependent methyltransferase
MIHLARHLAASTGTGKLIDFRVLPNEEIGSLQGENVFDGAFSNFCGLNCVEDLPAVVRELTRLVRPGAPVLLCMIGRFVPWEIVWFTAHGRPAKALRRLRGPHPASLGEGNSARHVTRVQAAEMEWRWYHRPTYLYGKADAALSTHDQRAGRHRSHDRRPSLVSPDGRLRSSGI